MDIPPADGGRRKRCGGHEPEVADRHIQRDRSATDARGNPIIAIADQSIQAGDGTVGFAIDTQAYLPIWFRSMVYFSASYLFNPADTNGVSSTRVRFRETINSITDQYLARGGISHAVPRFPDWW